MLIEFKVANYRSIRAEQTLSMVASNYSDELPQNLISCDDVPGLKGTKLVKAVALYGANASGKSNIIAALRFSAEFVRDSATRLQPDAPTGAQPFKLDPACLTEPSKFEVTAVIKGVRTLYGIELTRERVTREYLVAYPKGRAQVWFERDWDAAKKRYDWSKSTVHFKHDDALHEKTRENSAFLGVAAQFNLTKAKAVSSWFADFLHLIDLSHDLETANAARFTLGSKSLRKILADVACRADFGVIDVQLLKGQRAELARAAVRSMATRRELYDTFASKKEHAPSLKSQRPLNFDRESGPEGNFEDMMAGMLRDFGDEYSTPQLTHRSKDGSVALSYYAEESVGTQRYIEIAAELIMATALGGLFVIDELEISLHPLLVIELLRSYFIWKGGTLGAQLIFTTHNPLLLDQTLLRRDQIWFTEKDQEGATRLYPLTDFKPRKDESLVKGYLAGRYGGIPFIPEGLKF